MSDISIELHWQRIEPELKPGAYTAEHVVQFNNSHDIQVDAAPDYGGNPACTNPEQALASALSSCHMLTFLALAAKAKWPVASYHDYAVAHLGKNPKGQMSVTRVDLHPVVRFDTGFQVSEAEMEQMQDRAHRYCFIANTLADSVEVNILHSPTVRHFGAGEPHAAA
jgi:organic hydroperoxide reductase OsmC/OhrA